MEAVLFRQCAGYTDSTAIQTQLSDAKTGTTFITECRNLTVTDDGCIEKTKGLQAVYTHSLPITSVSSGHGRTLFSDAVDIYEFNDATGTATKLFPIMTGAIIHTPLDVRVSDASGDVYKHVNGQPTIQNASVGINPNPATSVVFQGMPAFDGGFVYNSRLFCYRDKFLMYSEPYHYDLWNLGDNFIGHKFTILQAGAIPGMIAVAYADGITAYIGGDPLSEDTVKRFYPCKYIDNTLYSGFIDKVLGYGHLFLCADGVYMLAHDGSMNRLSESNTENINLLNNSYAGAVLHDGKYLAYGNSLCIEYDFRVKAVMLRDSAATGVCICNNNVLIASADSLFAYNAVCNDAEPVLFTTPYSALASSGKKAFSDMYVTGFFGGDLEITAQDQTDPEEPDKWQIVVPELGEVQQKRIKLPLGTIGSKVAFRFSMESGCMRIEEIRVVFGVSQRR